MGDLKRKFKQGGDDARNKLFGQTTGRERRQAKRRKARREQFGELTPLSQDEIDETLARAGLSGDEDELRGRRRRRGRRAAPVTLLSDDGVDGLGGV